ncbi:hypothetical protein GO755_07855 [Spirosoma sp. HMF4905]|uniref:Uncharacterized protein n=1 Tax=Spirosoma arboris TaxID=2682092 RepID=A0A7K1S7X7_9BACT|nr:hypothetical protein [Spirosoma arboris]MVM29942.1 hypothetical protein [Spirosoma arboris]
MEIPIYQKAEVVYAGVKEGNYSYEDFNGFLYELLAANVLKEPALAIAQRAYDLGTECLSPDERHLLVDGIKEYGMVYCDTCRTVIVVKRNSISPYLFSVHKH